MSHSKMKEELQPCVSCGALVPEVCVPPWAGCKPDCALANSWRYPLKPQFELKISGDGVIEAMYQDGLAEVLGAETLRVHRASTIEWEEKASTEGLRRGWSVRSAHDPKMALRIVPDRHPWYQPSKTGMLALFITREQALEAEQAFFWELLDKR